MVTDNSAAVAHFWRHQHRAPNWVMNRVKWAGLTPEQVEEDINTAEWVPNRAMWRAKGFRNYAQAQAPATRTPSPRDAEEARTPSPMDSEAYWAALAKEPRSFA